MSDDTISLTALLKLIFRNFALIGLSILFAVAVSIFIAFSLPAKYKAKALLNIQASYFQNSLVGNLMPEVSDGGEQGAQRMSLLRMALSDEFLDKFGEQYKVYKSKQDDTGRVLEREELLKRIEYFAVTATTYQISVIAPEPQLSYVMTKDVLEQMIDTMYRARYNKLKNTRDAIDSNVQQLSLALEGVNSPTAYQHETLEAELDKIEINIKALTSQYTPNHPDVLKLRERANSIRNILKNYSGETEPSNVPQVFVNSSSKAAVKEVYEDLVKKLNYLNIMVDMESDKSKVSYYSIVEQPTIPTSSFFPPKKKIAALGLAAGLLLAAVLVVFVELRRGTFVSPTSSADLLEVPFLGELPILTGRQKVKLIEGPGANAVRHSLPSPISEG